MWTVFIVFNLGALLCAGSSSPPSPVNVTFSSVNLRNLLQWLPGSGTPDDTLFTVQYAIYGDSVEGKKGKRVHWRPVRRCTEIMRSWCDLSNETWDLEQGYHARVRAVRHKASSKWTLTHRRFDPKTDTRFGSPLVSVEIEDNHAIITVKGPMRYQPNNHTPEVSMATVYPQMIYNLSIGNTHRGLMHHFPVSSSLYKYRLMDYDTEYCFSARARFLSMPIQCRPSAWQCITTPQDPVIAQLQRLVVGIVVPALCMCMLALVGYLLYYYLTGKGQKSPYILHPPSFHPPVLTYPPEYPKIILITMLKEPGVALPSGYSSQRPEALQQPEEPWDDLSIDYGFVGEAPNMALRGEDGIHPTGEHGELVLRNSYEKKAWRVEDGHSIGQTDVSTLLQAHAWSQPSSLTQAQAPLLRFLEEADGEEEEDPEFPALLTNTTPSSNLPTNKEGGMGEEMDGKVRVRTDREMDGGVKEWSEDVKVPLVSAYAFQNPTHMSPSHSDSYGVVGRAAAVEEADEEEKGSNCIDWDPETRRLVLPLMLLEYNKEDGWDGLDVGENRMEEAEEEEEDLMNGELRLENVFVRQASNEKAEAQRGSERGGGTAWEAEDLLTRWDLVISMDQ